MNMLQIRQYGKKEVTNDVLDSRHFNFSWCTEFLFQGVKMDKAAVVEGESMNPENKQKIKKQINSNEMQQKDVSSDGYAFIDLLVLKDIVSKEGAYAMLIAYVVICFGVHKKKSKLMGKRISTHGIKSIVTRTNLTKGEAENAVQSLIDMGYLVDLRIGEKYVKNKPTFEVVKKGDEKDLVAVDSRFVQTESTRRDVWSFNNFLGGAELHHPNKYFLYSSNNQSRLEILYVFFNLLKKQNIGEFSGIDPAFFGSICSEVQNNDFVNEFNNFSDVAGKLYLCDIDKNIKEFQMCRIADFLKDVANPDSEDFEGRSIYVMEILVRAKLVNRVVTLWRSVSDGLSLNKLKCKKLIVATVGIENLEDQKIKGNFIFSEMLGKIKEYDVRMAFGLNGIVNRDVDGVLGGDKRWLCFVRRELAEEFFLCDHLRVAYMAGTNDNVQHLKSEEDRNSDYMGSLYFE